jgi:hypothetical protein
LYPHLPRTAPGVKPISIALGAERSIDRCPVRAQAVPSAPYADFILGGNSAMFRISGACAVLFAFSTAVFGSEVPAPSWSPPAAEQASGRSATVAIISPAVPGGYDWTVTTTTAPASGSIAKTPPPSPQPIPIPYPNTLK